MKGDCQIRSGVCEGNAVRGVYRRGKRYSACSECAEAVKEGDRKPETGVGRKTRKDAA